MMEMHAICSSEVRNGWSGVMDSVIRKRPAFIRRTRDFMMLSSIETISALVADVKYVADEFLEEDGSVTLSLRDMDIIANGKDILSAKKALVQDILEYADEYYAEYQQYYAAPNRKAHLPYIMKALTAKNPEELEEAVLCQPGRN
jgi:hypothetical protein